jgi:hypothetical protein
MSLDSEQWTASKPKNGSLKIADLAGVAVGIDRGTSRATWVSGGCTVTGDSAGAAGPRANTKPAAAAVVVLEIQ